MEIRSAQFKQRAVFAIHDASLQQALAKAREGFVGKRAEQVAALPEFEALREEAKNLKNHVLDNLDYYLERYEAAVTASGGTVHWARDAAEARGIILDICRRVGAKTVTKGKSMVSEEIGLNEALIEEGMEVVETDLG
jgi:L-lactate dehydrogenase complex protein LldF